jgi:O-antigen ligase/Flp pilus assembly protein TadD
MAGGMAKQIARCAALGSLFLIPVMPLIVTNSYLFPFISGKAFYFRILVEIAVAAWAVLALLDKDYRPRFSWLGATVVLFVSWMFVADSFAINANKAFWSNYERMEGWVLLIHLLGFFFAASSVLRVEKKWRAWFLTSLGISLVVTVHALLQIAGAAAIHQGAVRIDASLGNSAYLAIYFLFNVFIASWLALTESRVWLKWLLIAVAAIQGVLIFFTETRGTVIGLVVALTLAALLTVFTAGKRARTYATGGLIAILIIVGSFYLARESSFVQNNHTLQRIASISLADGQTRFTIWGMALEGVKERPVVGWGQEGFNYIFNTYYKPSMLQQEPWFDRAHNAFIDWLTAGGIPAFLLYVSLYLSAIFLLWKSSELSRPERIALTAAFVGYGVHNIFVFDNLYSYVYFFALLALIDSQVSRPIERLERAPVLGANEGVTYALPIAAVMALALIWTVNMPGMRVAKNLIVALSPSVFNPTTQQPEHSESNIVAFEKLAQRPGFAAQEVREQMISFAASVVQSSWATDVQKQRIAALAVNEMKKQVEAYPTDTRERLQLSYAYRVLGDGAGARAELEAAHALSPKKQQILIEKGMLEWELGDMKAAQTDFRAAYALSPQFTDLALYAAAGDIAAGDIAAGDKLLVEVFGTTEVDSDILASAYFRSKNWPRLIALWKARTLKPDAKIEHWFALAAVQYTSGDNISAIQTVRKVMALYPNDAGVANAGAAAIEQIQAGR